MRSELGECASPTGIGGSWRWGVALPVAKKLIRPRASSSCFRAETGSEIFARATSSTGGQGQPQTGSVAVGVG